VKEKHNFRDLLDFIDNSTSNKIAVVDIETTDLKPDKGLIVEIGIIELDLESGATSILFESIIKEAGFMDNIKYSWIFSNSDLKYEEVLKAPDLIDLKEDIQKILNHYHLTAYNKSFDFSFLESRGFLIKKELQDIMEVAKNICKIIKPSGEYKNPNFQEAWNYFFPESKYIEKHRALDDALHEALVLFEMYQKGYFPINFYQPKD
jgi:DNA polymerase-3 subunit epsilon